MFQQLIIKLQGAEEQYGFLSTVFKDRRGKGIIETEEGGRPHHLPLLIENEYQTFPSREISREIDWDHEVRITQGNVTSVYAVRTLFFFPDSPSYASNVFYLIEEIIIDPTTGLRQRVTHIQRADA